MYRKKIDYNKKFEALSRQKLYRKLSPDQKQFIRNLAFIYRFTHQEFIHILEIYHDLKQWGEINLEKWCSQYYHDKSDSKELFLSKLYNFIDSLRKSETVYMDTKPTGISRRNKPVVLKKSNKKIYGLCPVASDKTLCCQLRTIDAVESCPYSCTYCVIQTFYTDKFIFDSDFSKKLRQIKIDRTKFYHFGSGQSSDALIWGNRNGILDSLCSFADENQNILLEMKTKSDNVDYFLKTKIPGNIVCSWSLNTDIIIKNEEHFTTSLDQRLHAARTIADRGIKVAFHFHPMVYYKGWDTGYPKIASKIISLFKTEEVLFVSFGTVTLLRSTVKSIRELGYRTKITQMEMVPDPQGKLTYPDHIKIKLFKKIYQAFCQWHEDVFIYLCMEKPYIWKHSFGYLYKNNEEFERKFGEHTMKKL